MTNSWGGIDTCPGCNLAMFNGRCLTLGCIHYRFPPFWQVETEEVPALEEDNHLA